MSAANPAMVFTGVDAIRDALERSLPPLPENAVAPSSPKKPRAKSSKATAKSSKRRA